MTDDNKALVERLREMADEYDSGHHESWPTIDILNEAATEIEQWQEACNRQADWYAGDLAERDNHIEAQAAEIERLESLIGVTANHWLALQDKHPILWEGAIDAAMAAACAEIERLREALKSIAAECSLPVGTDKQMYARWRKLAVERVDIARAALGETA